MLSVENRIEVKNFFVAVHQVTCLQNVLHLPVLAVPHKMGGLGERRVEKINSVPVGSEKMYSLLFIHVHKSSCFKSLGPPIKGMMYRFLSSPTLPFKCPVPICTPGWRESVLPENTMEYAQPWLEPSPMISRYR